MDIYAEVTARIIDQMENGIIPWEKPWIACGHAVSHATGKAYSLLNQMLLGRPGEYVTFKQCQEAGILCRLAREAGKIEEMGSLNDIGTALYAFRGHIKKLQEAHYKAEHQPREADNENMC